VKLVTQVTLVDFLAVTFAAAAHEFTATPRLRSETRAKIRARFLTARFRACYKAATAFSQRRLAQSPERREIRAGTFIAGGPDGAGSASVIFQQRGSL